MTNNQNWERVPMIAIEINNRMYESSSPLSTPKFCLRPKINHTLLSWRQQNLVPKVEFTGTRIFCRELRTWIMIQISESQMNNTSPASELCPAHLSPLLVVKLHWVMGFFPCLYHLWNLSGCDMKQWKLFMLTTLVWVCATRISLYRQVQELAKQ